MKKFVNAHGSLSHTSTHKSQEKGSRMNLRFALAGSIAFLVAPCVQSAPLTPLEPLCKLGISTVSPPVQNGQYPALFIRCNYIDDLTEPISEADAKSNMEEANQFFVENSYGSVSTKTTVTRLLTLPRKRSDYTNGPNYIIADDSECLAKASGYDPDAYNFLFIQVNGLDSSGGGKIIRLGSSDLRTLIHEWGHGRRSSSGFGALGHANVWLSADPNNPAGKDGESMEYGNPFDIMGSFVGAFNVVHRYLLRWLPAGFPALSEEDILDLPRFADKLRQRTDKVSQYLVDRLSDVMNVEISNSGVAPKNAWNLDIVMDYRHILAEYIDNIIQVESIYDKSRFAGVNLSVETQQLLKQNPQGNARIRLNRLLLEDAYPTEIAKNRKVGFIQTVADSGVYRLSAFDVPELRPGLTYAIRIRRGDGRSYFFEFRQQRPVPMEVWTATGARVAANTERGILVYLYPSYGGGIATSELLDMTTNTRASGKIISDPNFLDAALEVGKTFVDQDAGIQVTPIQINPGTHRSIDIAIIFTREIISRPRLQILQNSIGANANTKPPFVVTLVGNSSAISVVETSSDLVTWTPVVTNANRSVISRFTDDSSVPLPLRFYRAVQLP